MNAGQRRRCRRSRFLGRSGTAALLQWLSELAYFLQTLAAESAHFPADPSKNKFSGIRKIGCDSFRDKKWWLLCVCDVTTRRSADAVSIGGPSWPVIMHFKPHHCIVTGPHIRQSLLWTSSVFLIKNMNDSCPVLNALQTIRGIFPAWDDCQLILPPPPLSSACREWIMKASVFLAWAVDRSVQRGDGRATNKGCRRTFVPSPPGVSESVCLPTLKIQFGPNAGL